jgi:DNA invertase Pin-like site-specific DNA recombinase
MNQELQFTNTSPLILPQEENGKPIHAIEAQKATVKYCLYARKSSEDDERQALSIDSQIKEMTGQSAIQGLQVVDIRTESHSAKSTGLRPVFNQLINDVRAGMFGGILSWAPDRLSRNAGDLGTIVDLMDNGYLKEIRTHGQIFTNSPNDKFLLMILCSQAKLENDNRGINVKRGQRTKCEMGVRPTMCPIGYLNDMYSGKGQKKIYIDPERAPIIKEMFEKVAYQDFSGRDIHEWFQKIGFRSKRGFIITLSSVYLMLNNAYYCGIFEYPQKSGHWYKGSYDAIISKELFKDVQLKLAVKPKSKPGTRIFNFTRILKCGTCGSGVTAQNVFKNCKDGKRKYIYYHCTKVRDHHCPEPYIREEELIKEFIKILEQLSADTIKSNAKLGEKLEIFRQFSVLETENNDPNPEQTALSKFLKHIFKEGSREEKRELVDCIKMPLYLNEGQVIVK